MSENENMISDEAVEAAAKGVWDVDRTFRDPPYEACVERTKDELRREARAALEAAASHMLAEAWDDGYGHGKSGDFTNPYRCQP